MVKYLKDCFGCFKLRFGIIIIACLEIMFTAYFVHDGVTHVTSIEDNKGKGNQREKSLVTNNITFFQHNANSSDYAQRKKSGSDANHAAFAAVGTVATLNLLFNIALLMSAIVNDIKICKLLLAWVCWTVIIIILTIMMIIFYLTIAETFLDGIRVLLVYGCGILLEIFCIWMVLSYHRFIKIRAHGPSQGYRIVFNSRGGEIPSSEPPNVTSLQPSPYSLTDGSDTAVVMLDH